MTSPQDEPNSDETWGEFQGTIIRIAHPTGIFDVAPADIDQQGDFLPGVTATVHVLTAWNPQGQQASAKFNAEAGTALGKELEAKQGLQVWPTTGFAPDEAWVEEGFTVSGLTRKEALELAIRWDQRAIFEWSNEPGGFRLVACDGTADEQRGWNSRTL